MAQQGYYWYPTIFQDQIVFVSEDDLWTVPTGGGQATRLTNGHREISTPHFSPDGKHIAFIGREDGNAEVYVIASTGGEIRRLSYSANMRTRIAGWSKDGKSIIYCSGFQMPSGRRKQLFSIDLKGGLPKQLGLGIADSIVYGPKKQSVIGRNTGDIARWKRYRGGTVGKIWIDAKGDGKYKELKEPGGNNASPMWIGSRVYFISDHEGIGNIYSVNPQGQDLKKHSSQNKFYARNATTDGQSIVYHAGADLFVLDVKTGKENKVEIQFNSSRTQLQRKFVNPGRFLEYFTLHPEGHSLMANVRGKVFEMPNWQGPVKEIGTGKSVRQRLPSYLNCGEGFITISDKGGTEVIEIHSRHSEKVTRLEKLDIGRVVNMKVSPNDAYLALSNHRCEILIVDLKKKKIIFKERTGYYMVHGYSWAPDSNWLVYVKNDVEDASKLMLYNLKNKKTTQITSGDFMDTDPCFDPEGRFLYFFSRRVFNPVYDNHYFDLGFPRGFRPYLISLQAENMDPFIPEPKAPGDDDDDDKKKKRPQTKSGALRIDLDGIKDRLMEFPVQERNYYSIAAVEDKVIYTCSGVVGSMDRYYGNPNPKKSLYMYDFEKQREVLIANNVASFEVATKNESIIYWTGKKLRVQSIQSRSSQSQGSAHNRRDGWVDLDRMKVAIVAKEEWKQMFHELWRLQKQMFWSEDMAGIKWEAVYKAYAPLVDRLGSRAELSDLAWEVQGELGTSHAYESGGDYRLGPYYGQGLLGIDFVYDAKEKAYRITHIVDGDNWTQKSKSPLRRLGVNAKVGDCITAVNGTRLDKHTGPYSLLVNQVNTEVVIGLKEKGKKAERQVTVKTLATEDHARYREWVEQNRAYVHKKTKGKIGYLHVPNMGPDGYAEFHRYYALEVQREGLIVDVRFNGGGHVSQLLLEKLARKPIGFGLSRWQPNPDHYPNHSPLGPLVALTNEYAGSDGDIFSHCFKLMGLGPLIGKRTWGGVVGIWPRHQLVDGTVTTQPEFSSWYMDVGYGVENYGTDPDIEVDYAPQDYKAGIDPQLDRAISEVLKAHKKNPPKYPDFSDKPKLKLPW